MNRDEALALYSSLGLATLPLRPRSKRPLRKGWQTPDPEVWRDAPPDANVGVLTGAPSGGLIVLDFDTMDGPRDVLGFEPRELACHTIVVETSRGYHVYLRGVARSQRRNGLDVKGDGGFVVAPPSVHASGIEYRFLQLPIRIEKLENLAPDVGIPSAAEPRAPLPDMVGADEIVAAQAPKLQAAWCGLKRGGSVEFDRSSADFAIAKCLWEHGWPEEEIATLLCALPGSKARERGWAYALRTVRKAAQVGLRPH